MRQVYQALRGCAIRGCSSMPSSKNVNTWQKIWKQKSETNMGYKRIYDKMIDKNGIEKHIESVYTIGRE